MIAFVYHSQNDKMIQIKNICVVSCQGTGTEWDEKEERYVHKYNDVV